MSQDISFLVQGWDYDPNEVTVRKITGLDGREKIQMRLDLGILQMETEGRPDGRRPFGRESLLEYHLERRARITIAIFRCFIWASTRKFCAIRSAICAFSI